MRRYTYLLGLVLTSTLVGHPARAFADFSDPTNLDSSVVQPYAWEFSVAESPGQNYTTEPFDTVAVDYCYRGSVVDPTTGEIVDLYVLCSDEGAEEELDVA